MTSRRGVLGTDFIRGRDVTVTASGNPRFRRAMPSRSEVPRSAKPSPIRLPRWRQRGRRPELSRALSEFRRGATRTSRRRRSTDWCRTPTREKLLDAVQQESQEELETFAITPIVPTAGLGGTAQAKLQTSAAPAAAIGCSHRVRKVGLGLSLTSRSGPGLRSGIGGTRTWHCRPLPRRPRPRESPGGQPRLRRPGGPGADLKQLRHREP